MNAPWDKAVWEPDALGIVGPGGFASMRSPRCVYRSLDDDFVSRPNIDREVAQHLRVTQGWSAIMQRPVADQIRTRLDGAGRPRCVDSDWVCVEVVDADTARYDLGFVLGGPYTADRRIGEVVLWWMSFGARRVLGRAKYRHVELASLAELFHRLAILGFCGVFANIRPPAMYRIAVDSRMFVPVVHLMAARKA